MQFSLRHSSRGGLVPDAYLHRGAEVVLLLACLFSVGFFQPEFVVASVHLAELDLNLFIENRSGSNIFSQVKWIGLGAIAGVMVMVRTDRFLRMASLCWPLILLMAIAAITVIWSVDPGTTLKRTIRTAIFVFVVLTALAYIRDWRRAVFIVYLAYCAMLLQNLAGLAIPGTFDLGGNFTGATSQKNQLGIIAAVGILVGAWVRTMLSGRLPLALNLIFIAAWFGLLVLSFSKTALALIVVAPLLMVGFFAIADILRVGVGFAMLLLFSLFFAGLGLVNAMVGMTPMALVHLIKDDVTFTGRTQIWAFLYEKLQESLIGGFGFGAFWGQGTDSPSLTAPYPYMWFLDSAHNGYLDIVANVGFIGIAGLVILLIHYSLAVDRVCRRDRRQAFAFWSIMFFILSHNMMESSLMRPTETAMWFLFLFTYVTALRSVGDMRLGAIASDSDQANRDTTALTATSAT
jgi:O-antigen ligase